MTLKVEDIACSQSVWLVSCKSAGMALMLRRHAGDCPSCLTRPMYYSLQRRSRYHHHHHHCSAEKDSGSAVAHCHGKTLPTLVPLVYICLSASWVGVSCVLILKCFSSRDSASPSNVCSECCGVPVSVVCERGTSE